MKNGEIILCKGIKLDKNFENVLSYSEANMVTLCRNNAIATTTKYSILDPTVRSIDIALPYSSCITANYIAFKNPYYGNKWYFGFVNDVKYINNNTTTVEYTLDVFSTWYSKFSIGKAFIEREHVSDDTFGLHTIEENLSTGEFVINSAGRISNKLAAGKYIVAVNKFISGMGDYPTDTTYGNVYSGYAYLYFRSVAEVRKLINAYDGYGVGDAIINIFTIPASIITEPTPFPSVTIPAYEGSSGDVTISVYKLPGTVSPYELETNKVIEMNTTLNGYTPKNNKMYCYPFNYLLINNNAGNEVVFKYEEFIGSPAFNIDGVICPGCSIKLYPVNYKRYSDIPYPSRPHWNPVEFNYGLTSGKYPNCSWSNDAYTNWLTQNAVNREFDTIRDETQLISGIPGLATGNFDGVAEGLNGILRNIAGDKQRSFMPNQTKGNVNAGDVSYASNSLTFMYYKMSVNSEYAKICDDFLSRFGYKVNEIKTPNLLSRTKFNYIKVGGMDELVSGDIPASDLETINSIFRKGVTIFHDYSTFGDYTQTNSIVTTP